MHATRGAMPRLEALLIVYGQVVAGRPDCDSNSPQQRCDSDQNATSGVWHDIREMIREHRCHSVYLDIGSNIGVQIRKLYEPALYNHIDPKMRKFARMFNVFDEPTPAERDAGIQKGASFWNTTPPVLPVFEEYFGPAPRCGVCAIGVEPNPWHTPRHAALQAALRGVGVGALWLSETAVDVTDGWTTIEGQPGQRWKTGVNGVGAQIGRGNFRVKTMDLARLVHFVHRHLRKADDGRPSKLVMKIDTEGTEYRVLPHLLARRAACLLDFIFLEWHPEPAPYGSDRQREVRQMTMDALRTKPCKTAISDLDDETFLTDGKPFPSIRMCASRGGGRTKRRRR